MKRNKYFKKRDKVLNVRSSTPLLQELENIKSDMLKLTSELDDLKQSVINLNHKKVDKDAIATRKEDKIRTQGGKTQT